jgi:hypothetical protein
MGLIKETEDSRYFVDALIFENMIRIKRSLIPIQIDPSFLCCQKGKKTRFLGDLSSAALTMALSRGSKIAPIIVLDREAHFKDIDGVKTIRVSQL